MAFRLSKASKRLLTQSTGIDYKYQVAIPLDKVLEQVPLKNRQRYKIKSVREISPRGSVYLQVGRILSLSKVKKLIGKI